MPLVLLIPVNPVPASRPRMSRGSRIYYPATYSRFKREVPPVIRALCQLEGLCRPLDDELTVVITVCPKRPKTTKLTVPMPDVDNYAKAVLDVANGIVWHDDKQVVGLLINKQWAAEGSDGYFELRVTEHHNCDLYAAAQRLLGPST